MPKENPDLVLKQIRFRWGGPNYEKSEYFQSEAELVIRDVLTKAGIDVLSKGKEAYELNYGIDIFVAESSKNKGSDAIEITIEMGLKSGKTGKRLANEKHVSNFPADLRRGSEWPAEHLKALKASPSLRKIAAAVLKDAKQ